MIKIDGTEIKADFFLVPKCLEDANVSLKMDVTEDTTMWCKYVGTGKYFKRKSQCQWKRARQQEDAFEALSIDKSLTTKD